MIEVSDRGGRLQIVRMVIPFTFDGETYPSGSYLILWPFRLALSAAQFDREFSTQRQAER